MKIKADISEEIGPTRLFGNIRTDMRFLAVEQPNRDLIYAELDENDIPIYTGNRFSRNEFNQMLEHLEMEADYNTVPFTFVNGEFVERKRPERL